MENIIVKIKVYQIQEKCWWWEFAEKLWYNERALNEWLVNEDDVIDVKLWDAIDLWLIDFSKLI